MKSILLIFVLGIIASSHARWLSEMDREKFLTFDQQPLSNNHNIAYSSRIINGEPANIADFPYMLALLDLTAGGRMNI